MKDEIKFEVGIRPEGESFVQPELFLCGQCWVAKGYDWIICRQGSLLTIGCETHSVESWMEFSDTEIGYMDRRALSFWRKYKHLLIEKGILG